MDKDRFHAAGNQARRGGSRKVAAAARRSTLLAALWLVLAEGQGLFFGAAATAIGCWLSLVLLPPGRPLRLLGLVAMAPRFLRRSLLGGIDVARRALDPRLPLNPGWVVVEVDLPDGDRAALGGELSLMPGTLVAGSEGRRLLVHVLERNQDVEGSTRAEEAHLARTFGSSARDAP